ncbi:MAG TPA: HisA/HisF-related TIM barrel protein [Acidobacteriota bacterium]|nr:HisA/HisF-related TIM barrel protein [Acidobacteriota bacterium]
MRIIPVLDLLNDQAVHAIRGERENYQPVQSVLCDTSDPYALVKAFRDRLNLHEIYIADLNSIQGFSHTRHRSMIQNLCAIEGIHIILDAGASDRENAQVWLDLGIRKAVVGSETLRTLEDLDNLPAGISPHRLVFSLDFKNGKIQSQCDALAAMPPTDALKRLQSSGWQEVILLDLDRVGSREGADLALAANAHYSFPDLCVLIGGGVSKPEEMLEMQSLGIAGVLVATALHSGVIGAGHIAGLRLKK